MAVKDGDVQEYVQHEYLDKIEQDLLIVKGFLSRIVQ